MFVLTPQLPLRATAAAMKRMQPRPRRSSARDPRGGKTPAHQLSRSLLNACRLASMDIEELKLLRGFGRIAYSETGKPTLKYRAIDPADHYVRCSCGNADCWTHQLTPLREHMVALFRAIGVCGLEEQFEAFNRSEDPWPGVIYALQMAASLEDVFADPSYVGDSEAAFWCRPAWE